MLDKKNIIKQQGIVPLFVVLTIGLYLTFSSYEYFLKKKLEDFVSLTYGARVDIQSLSASPLKGILTLKKLQITHPLIPLKNIFEIDQIDISFSFSELLKKKWVISSIQLKGFHPLTQRVASGLFDYSSLGMQPQPLLWEKTNSGAYTKLRDNIKQGPLKYLSQITTGAYTPSKLPNLNKTLASLRYLEDLNQSLEKATREWTSMSSALPSGAKLDQWQSQVAKWDNSPRTLASNEEMESRRALAKLIRENHGTVTKKLKDATKSIGQFKLQMEGLSPILAKDVETMKKDLSLPTTNDRDLSLSLFGLTFISVLEKFSYWVDLYRTVGTVDFRKPNYERIQMTSGGKTQYKFLSSDGTPSFFVKRLSLNEASLGSHSKGFISLEITDFVRFPRFYRMNPSFKLEATIPEFDLEGLKLDFTADHLSSKPKETLKVDVEAFPIDNSVIRSTSDFEIRIAHASGKLSLNCISDGNKINARAHFETSGTRFQVKSRFQVFEEILESLTKYRTSLAVEGTAHKKDEDIQISIQSELGKQIADEMTTAFKKQLAEIDDTLKSHILDALFPLRQSFNDKIQDAENMVLAQMRSTLNDLELMMNISSKYDPDGKKYKETFTSKIDSVDQL